MIPLSDDLTAILRMLLVFGHLLALLVAGAGIAFGDYAIFARPRIDADLLHAASRLVSGALLGLWATGLAIIGLDTGFALVGVTEQPKLLAKLTVVVVLSVNGLALHRFAFRRLVDANGADARILWLAPVMGAISIVTWLYAMFVGLARPAAPYLGYDGFVRLYVVILLTGIVAALLLVRPRLRARLSPVPS